MACRALPRGACPCEGESDVHAFIDTFAGDDRNVVDYLTTEVLAGQSAEIYDFLLRTSVLERLCPALCDEVSGGSGSAEKLRRIEGANAFLVALDNRREWYRYHHLFRDLLRNELHGNDPDGADDANRRAAKWFREHGDTSEAILHTIAAGDISDAVEMVASSWRPVAYAGGHQTVQGWLRALPREVHRGDARLCVASAVTAIGIGRLDEVGPWIELASQRPAAGPFYDGFTSGVAAADCLRSANAWLTGDLTACRASALNAIERGDGPSPWDAFTYTWLGASTFWLGQQCGRHRPPGDRARALSHRAAPRPRGRMIRRDAQQQPGGATAVACLGMLGLIHLLQGDLDQAQEQTDAAMTLSAMAGLQEYWVNTAAHIARADLLTLDPGPDPRRCRRADVAARAARRHHPGDRPVAGCSEALLYKHFADKEDIFLAVLSERLPQLITLLKELPGRAGERTSPRCSPRWSSRPVPFFAAGMPIVSSLFARPDLAVRHQTGCGSAGPARTGRTSRSPATCGPSRSGAGWPRADLDADAALLLGAATSGPSCSRWPAKRSSRPRRTGSRRRWSTRFCGDRRPPLESGRGALRRLPERDLPAGARRRRSRRTRWGPASWSAPAREAMSTRSRRLRRRRRRLGADDARPTGPRSTAGASCRGCCAASTERDLSTTVLGTAMPAPVLLAPVGVLDRPPGRRSWRSPGRRPRSGCRRAVLTRRPRSIEEVAEAGRRRAALVPALLAERPRARRSLVQRAEAAGYSALVVTLDTWHWAGGRATSTPAYLPFLQGEGIANYLTDPAFRAGLAKPPEEDPQARRAALGRSSPTRR